ncbi:hypothetical protein BF28_5647 (plasmid) [Bacillus cereus E33L]|nr:hypothetical protein BF28_5647 [Bacillus cereus E33L]
MNQLSFIAEKEIRILVVKKLKNYKALCIQMKNKVEQVQGWDSALFPKRKDDDKNHKICFKQIERCSR